jgi:hypothetical protein
LEANTSPSGDDLVFNGVADVYTFQFDGFRAGDFIKVQLNGDPAHKEGPSLGGFLFDTNIPPNLTLPSEP